MSLAIALHLVAAVVWVGGMFFAYMCLRPVAAEQLEPPQRLALWAGTFSRFFPWVWAVVVVLPLTGYWMIFGFFGGMAGTGWHVHLMQAVGWVMFAIFAHLYFAPYRRLRRAVAAQDWPEGGRILNQIRRMVGLNLLLGLITTIVASGGRYLPLG